MKKIDVSKLKKGDIILSTSTARESAVIRFFINSDISHAMLYVANSSVMDSTGEGVQARNIDKMFYDDSCAIYAYRPIMSIPDATLDLVVGYVRAETGAPYSVAEAIVSPIALYGRGGKNQFCSRLIARAYASVGLRISKNPEFATPANIQRSTQLRQLEDVSISVSTGELEAVTSQEDTTVGMRAVTNNLLAALRKIESSIRVLHDIEPFLMKNPMHDAEFAAAFVESGYLTYWRVEVERFPWRYDPVAIVQFYHALDDKEELLDYCRETLRHDAEGDFAHWAANAKAMQKLFSEMPLETFRLELDLYLKLCFHHEQRVKSAKILLRVYGDSAS
ncbi:YiiX/YebB-like N1pC/P60 family cysteine hydrolase [Caballeronia sp. ATUFL_F1_KS4A]|uniref:YiiX/YebB-like N1pC/P60 family cysteine hydrolase n=1 Tax=Caballeronia sp. ATUFL_F1_KS4A TaxID=2921768 RepID=UPI002027917B|nr:YiiX/YebB-like N1pC/P60 family cysteine hydrolase [Caballeronia sp. ATUFL_F1_KS4A]